MSHVATKFRVKYHLNDYYFQCCIILFDVILNVNKLLFTVGRWHIKKKVFEGKGLKTCHLRLSIARRSFERANRSLSLSLSFFLFPFASNERIARSILDTISWVATPHVDRSNTCQWADLRNDLPPSSFVSTSFDSFDLFLSFNSVTYNRHANRIKS